MKRRTFIQTGSLMTLPVLLRGMEVTAIAKSSLATLVNPDDDKVLVLVQLNGGNDGLNTFIPLDQYDALVKARANILLPENEVLKTSQINGFHKSLAGFDQLYKDGLMSVVQSVGYPNQNRSHFRSTDIWTTASDSEQYITTGWLGRYFDLNYPGYPDGYPNAENPDPFAITLGFVVSETCQGQASNYSFTVNSEADIKSLNETVPGNSDGSCFSSELSYLKDVVRQTNAYSSQVLEAFDKGNNLVTYAEDNNLAAQLKIVANLISGGLRTKIYVVSQGGYDTHANQVVGGEPVTGTHAELLASLGDAIKNFQDDLVALGIDQRVVGMTFSEFGRRIKANDSFGTDHGTAAPLFVFGSCVNAGIYGQNPQISDPLDNEEGVPMQYDFRSVYASLLMDWFKTPKEGIEQVLFREFQHIPFLKDCAIGTGTEEVSSLELTLSPNPAQDYVNLEFDSNGKLADVDIFDVRGYVVKSVSSRTIGEGPVTMGISLQDILPGLYFVRVAQGNRIRTQKFVRM
ncbi:MAG: DUF1501 domain-containing protein [Saprospiraceae bacterium]|nr:DUF1501 domain-containing protein [Saprospiraceae bacterium]